MTQSRQCVSSSWISVEEPSFENLELTKKVNDLADNVRTSIKQNMITEVLFRHVAIPSKQQKNKLRDECARERAKQLILTKKGIELRLQLEALEVQFNAILAAKAKITEKRKNYESYRQKKQQQQMSDQLMQVQAVTEEINNQRQEKKASHSKDIQQPRYISTKQQIKQIAFTDNLNNILTEIQQEQLARQIIQQTNKVEKNISEQTRKMQQIKTQLQNLQINTIQKIQQWQQAREQIDRKLYEDTINDLTDNIEHLRKVLK